MWKRYFILLISCVLLTSGAWAQGSGFRQLAKTFTKYPARTKVSGTLAQRVERSYQTATLSHLRNQGQSPFYFPPTYHMQPLLNVDPATLYPDVPFLATPAQLSDYFLSRNNREISTAIAAQQRLVNELAAHTEDIQRSSRSVLEGEEVNFLVHQIPENTSYLLVGEHHDVFSIYIHISLLMTKLSKKYGCDNRPSAICECNHTQLSKEALENTSFLFHKIFILRNQFCHNFLGTIGARDESDKQIVNYLIHEYPNMIRFDDTSIHILKREFVSEVLEKERFVLNELIIKLKL